MNNTYPLFFLMVLVAIWTAGCTQTQGAAATEAPAQTVVAEVPSPLAQWLAQAEAPAQVVCSVPQESAPSAVADFNAISEKVFAIYQRVYQDAQDTAAGKGADMQTALAAVAEKVQNLPDAEQRAAIQATITANYQATMREIEAQSKALANYTENLSADGSISNITNRLAQNATRLKLGGDTVKLGKQLKAAGEGASVILRSRIEATQPAAQ